VRTTIATETVRLIQQLEPREDIDVALRQMLENEVRRRLSSYELTDRMFQRKYGMTLEEFEASGMVEKRNYSFEVENDHQEWDQAVDGIKTLREVLQKLEQRR
jgi:hypothetical protein